MSYDQHCGIVPIVYLIWSAIEYDFIRPELFGNNAILKDIFDNVSSDYIILTL